MKQSYIHIYTGNGKGKTTAALGIALRAICAGKKVYFGQFIKGGKYSESRIPQLLPHFDMVQFGRDCFIRHLPTEEDIQLARNGLEICKKILSEGNYDMVVLDEIGIALHYRLFPVCEVVSALEHRAPHTEVILTGRNMPSELVEISDLVTEMREIKHYYQTGVLARDGIDR